MKTVRLEVSTLTPAIEIVAGSLTAVDVAPTE
jgi:hypothetical protein